ncbi:MAG: tetratricopeptide repeat protein [Melioribacteraceae bacterium]|nr:tetratricopeptide repeat protein [Melioribacteraceae bacterium]
MDKFSLIYEFNTNSPLFAKVAETELEKKHIDKALNILEKGLEIYPDYSTAYIIYSQALAAVGDFDKAEEILRKGCDLIDSKSTYKYYVGKLYSIKERHSLLSESKRASFIPNNIDDIEVEPDEQKPLSFEDNLDDLASKLNSAKISSNGLSEEYISGDDTYNDLEDEEEIVSETVAGIYVAQGNLNKAISVYKKLMEQNPEKSDILTRQISDLEAKLDSQFK